LFRRRSSCALEEHAFVDDSSMRRLDPADPGVVAGHSRCWRVMALASSTVSRDRGLARPGRDRHVLPDRSGDDERAATATVVTGEGVGAHAGPGVDDVVDECGEHVHLAAQIGDLVDTGVTAERCRIVMAVTAPFHRVPRPVADLVAADDDLADHQLRGVVRGRTP